VIDFIEGWLEILSAIFSPLLYQLSYLASKNEGASY
jgi:hypothetical protein